MLAWYESWTSSLPLAIKEHPMIKSHVVLALSMLNAASEYGNRKDKNDVNTLLPKVPDVTTTYDRILLRMRRENGFNSHGSNTFQRPSGRNAAPVRPAHDISLGGGDDGGSVMRSTYRDVVEMFAQEHGIEFLPKSGTHAGQKLYSMDGLTCYLDRGVMYVRGRDGEYLPMSLEEAREYGVRWKKEKNEKKEKKEKKERDGSSSSDGRPTKRRRYDEEKDEKMHVEEDIDDLD